MNTAPYVEDRIKITRTLRSFGVWPIALYSLEEWSDMCHSGNLYRFKLNTEGKAILSGYIPGIINEEAQTKMTIFAQVLVGSLIAMFLSMTISFNYWMVVMAMMIGIFSLAFVRFMAEHFFSDIPPTIKAPFLQWEIRKFKKKSREDIMNDLCPHRVGAGSSPFFAEIFLSSVEGDISVKDIAKEITVEVAGTPNSGIFMEDFEQIFFQKQTTLKRETVGFPPHATFLVACLEGNFVALIARHGRPLSPSLHRPSATILQLKKPNRKKKTK